MVSSKILLAAALTVSLAAVPSLGASASSNSPAFASSVPAGKLASMGLRRPSAISTMRMSGGSATDSKKIVVKQPTEEEKATAQQWPTWGCDVSKFPWSYGENETCLLITGECTVTPTGGEPVSIKAGDMVTFPAGMSCTWDVTKPISKHYNFF